MGMLGVQTKAEMNPLNLQHAVRAGGYLVLDAPPGFAFREQCQADLRATVAK